MSFNLQNEDRNTAPILLPQLLTREVIIQAGEEANNLYQHIIIDLEAGR